MIVERNIYFLYGDMILMIHRFCRHRRYLPGLVCNDDKNSYYNIISSTPLHILITSHELMALGGGKIQNLFTSMTGGYPTTSLEHTQCP